MHDATHIDITDEDVVVVSVAHCPQGLEGSCLGLAHRQSAVPLERRETCRDGMGGLDDVPVRIAPRLLDGPDVEGEYH